MPQLKRAGDDAQPSTNKSRRAIDLAGQRFGRLLIIELATPIGKRGERGWLAVCDCGKGTVVRTMPLRHQGLKSCGCIKADVCRARATHGEARVGAVTKEYRAWQSAKKRCYDPNFHAYSYYGGRGIRMCDQWLNDYPAFLAHMGRCPPGLTLDRIDTNGNYEPGNVRWTTYSEQNRNRRPHHLMPPTAARLAKLAARAGK